MGTADSHFCDPLLAQTLGVPHGAKGTAESAPVSVEATGRVALARLIGGSAAIAQVRDRIVRIAGSPSPVLILGETGTGKEVSAAAIAALSGRQPFVAVNCGALAEGVVDSELFGHERGAFTGAIRSHDGLIAEANGGILFLDELADLPKPTQAKLLRTLESGEYRRVGSTKVRTSRFRILAATNADVDRAGENGPIRNDLLYRLWALRLRLPPLRDRREDIPVLVRTFLGRLAPPCNAMTITATALEVFTGHDWPGNIRQLGNMVEAAAALATGGVIDAAAVEEALETRPVAGTAPVPTLGAARDAAERRAIAQALHAAGGRRDAAAELLGVSSATLYRKLQGRNGARDLTP